MKTTKCVKTLIRIICLATALVLLTIFIRHFNVVGNASGETGEDQKFENEVPRRFFTRRKDGVYEPNYLDENGLTVLPEFKHKGEKIVDIDLITPGKVGGEHSDFIYLGDDFLGNKGILFRDQ